MNASRYSDVHPGVLARSALLGASVLVAAGLGVATSQSGAKAAVAVGALCLVAAAAAVPAVRRMSRDSLVGLTAGVLILGAVNALPGPNLETTYLGGKVRLEDVCILALIGVLGWTYRRRGPSTPHSSYTRMAQASCLLVILWWLLTLLRSWVVSDVPLPRAALFGRDFLYLALIFPLAIPLVRSARSRRALVTVLAVGAMVTAVGQSLVSLDVGALPQLVHVSDLGRDNGLVRVHSPASALVAASLPFAVGAVLFSGGSVRILAGVVACVSAAAVALELTRAVYFGVIAGLAIAVVVWAFLAPGGAVGRRRLWRIAATAAVAVAALASYQPASTAGTAVNGVRTRFLSGVAEFTHPQTPRSTLAFRNQERRVYARALRGHELVGLGFLPPTTFAIAGLPRWTQGSIRNSDVGVYNALMTMGLVGVVIYALPFLVAAWANIAARGRVRVQDRWLAFGCLAWLIMAIVTSWNLVVLFSPPGVVLSALILATTVATSEDSPSRGRSSLGDE